MEMLLLKYLPERDLLNLLKSKSIESLNCFCLIRSLEIDLIKRLDVNYLGNCIFNDRIISISLWIRNYELDWHYFSPMYFNNGLYAACSVDNLDLVNLMIKLGADDFNYGLNVACSKGNRKIVDLMIEKGAYDFNDALTRACLKGHYELIELMIRHGATKCFSCERSMIDHIKLKNN